MDELERNLRDKSLQDLLIDEGRHRKVKNYAQVSNFVVFLFIGSVGKGD